MAELAPTQALQDMGGHGAPCLAASAQATLGDQRGGGQGPVGPQPPSSSPHSPLSTAGHHLGTARAPELVAVGGGKAGFGCPSERAVGRGGPLHPSAAG